MFFASVERIALGAALFVVLSATMARAQEKVSTCVQVESGSAPQGEIARLVSSEVDRHPSHHAVTEGCSTHLKVELIQIGNTRFLTGRVDGEVPDRVEVNGSDEKALERALVELLRVVLGTDPVALKTPGGQSWVSARVLELKDHARGTFDVAPLETASLIGGHLTFRPGILLAYSREIADVQVGLEAIVSQNLDSHPGTVDLDTQIRLNAAVTYFFSSDADVSGFAGVAVGLAHQRFSGPRPAADGGGDGLYNVTGPALGLRAGVELFRTTTTRAYALTELFLPVFWANDQNGEILKGWVPGLAVGVGVRF